ncbi:MAG: phosphatidylinositol mannoside acyltransferase [Ilumatobacteraceae bacterium]|nr:phosphatidylinositol mannoside acyltransferase [Ilumatobacteraceae bacterium]
MPKISENISGWLTVSTYRLGSLIAKLIPVPIAQRTVALLAPVLALALRHRRAIIQRHLKRVDPSLTGEQLRRASQKSFESYMRYYVESFQLPKLSRSEVEKSFTMEGLEHIVQALERGKGAIMVIPHLGGWEWAGRWMAENGHNMTVVVEALEPPKLFEWFTNLRSSLGMNVLPLGPAVVPGVLAALKANQVVCLLSDRDIGRSGIEVEFFGERTTLPAGPATLAFRADSVVIPSAAYFTPDVHGHHTVIRPPLSLDRHGSLRQDVERVTQDIAHELEVLIRRHPEQWHMFQPNWPSDPGYEMLDK